MGRRSTIPEVVSVRRFSVSKKKCPKGFRRASQTFGAYSFVYYMQAGDSSIKNRMSITALTSLHLFVGGKV